MGKVLYKLLIWIFGIYSCSGNYLGNDIRLFRDTPVWELAKAVQSQDTVKIQKIIDKDNINIDYQEPEFGITLLMLSIHNQWKASAKVLLKNGANPNLSDNYNGESAITEASGWGPDYENDSDLLHLVLQYGGDPNYIAVSKRHDSYYVWTTPLIEACISLEKTKILVEAGADMNYVSPNGEENPLIKAILMRRTDVTKYLLIEKGANYRNAEKSVNINGDTIKVINMLRRWVFPLDSKEYKVKMEIVDYMLQQGENYWEAPIPKDVQKKHSKEYLEKY
jgi:ankyrin repeat protein